MLGGLVMQSAGKLMMNRFQNPAMMRSVVRQAQHDFSKDEDIPPLLRPKLQEMMGTLDKFMKSWAVVETAAAETKSSSKTTGGELDFQLARIETVDVTRQIPHDSSEALVQAAIAVGH